MNDINNVYIINYINIDNHNISIITIITSQQNLISIMVKVSFIFKKSTCYNLLLTLKLSISSPFIYLNTYCFYKINVKFKLKY